MNTKFSKKITVALVLIVCLSFLLTGCKKKDEIIGTWAAESMVVDGTEVNLEEAAAAQNVDLDQIKLTIVANEDKTIEMKFGGETKKGTWDKKDSVYSFLAEGDSEGDALTTEIKDGKITIDLGGDKMILKKEK